MFNAKGAALATLSMLAGLIAVVATIGCSVPHQNQPPADQVWAINIAGPSYQASDGTHYLAEMSVTGGVTGVLGGVKGSQDAVLYETYREGDIRVAQPFANGLYDLTFHFAEPDQIGAGQRVFDAYAEGRRVIGDLDVMVLRDGQVQSALTVTAANVAVTDGTLDISFVAKVGQPLLSALVVRPQRSATKHWQLVWADEFEVDGAPDPNNWTIQEWPSRVVNSEDQAYTARPKNVRVENGLLIVEAHKEPYDEAAYTSGRVHSSGKRDFLYGRFEARAKVPRGVGNWAAIWMLPSNPFTYATTCTDREDWQGSHDCDAWPNSGEIDILEHVGYQEGHVHGTVHNRAYYFINRQQRKGRVLVDDISDAFHVYAVEWSADRIDVLVDDTLYFTYINEGEDWKTWPYDQPFHIIINLAIGGDWGRAGGPIDDSVFPQRLVVDYVRVYQLKN